MTVREGREIELKLELRPQDAARLGGLKSLRQSRLGPAKAEQMVTVYFDTPDFALRRAGLSLRLRYAGARRIQTVKGTPNGEGLAADRLEDEVPVNGTGPDIGRIANEGLRKRLLKAARKEALAPLFETAVLRTTRHIRTAKGDMVELVVDLGEVRSEKEDAPISELELELKSGSAASLYELAAALNDTVPLRLVSLTKADRGYALLGERLGTPQKSRRLTLPQDATAGEALGPILESALAQLIANEPAVVECRDAEGLHQFRVALRRLRAALSSYAPLLGEKHVQALEHEIKWISAVCGAARDYDVFLDSILPAAADALSALAEGRQAVEQAAQRAREDAWAKVIEAVASTRFTRLALSLAILGASGKPPLARDVKRRILDEPAGRFAADTLDRQLKKAAKLGVKLSSLSDEDRHRLRKRLKRLRYAAEFFASLFSEEKTRPYLKRLGALQDCFGALNDLATAGRLIEAMRGFGSGKNAAVLAEAGRLILGHQRQAADALMGEAVERWDKLARRKPFWRET